LFSSETKHQLHAKEVARSLDIKKHDGIVCVSGDGILVEVSFIVIVILQSIILCRKITEITITSDKNALFVLYHTKF